MQQLSMWQTVASGTSQRALNLSARTRPALSTLEDMEQEAGSLPAAVPETEALTALLQKAEEWKAKAAALTAQKAPLKKMRDVLHMGLRMPVEVPQVEALRAEIRRREWEDTAKKVCTYCKPQ